jgi:hypothetical protein
LLHYKRGCRICRVYQRHPVISIQTWHNKEWGTNMGQSHSRTSPTERPPKELLLSVYTQIQEGSSGKASDQPIVCRFCGNNQIMSVSRGGEPNFEEFNLSSLYRMSHN